MVDNLAKLEDAIEDTFEWVGDYVHSDNEEWLHVVEHDELQGVSLKVKDPSSLGVDDTKQYSGYLDVEDEAHIFYWFFESRNDPANDPVLVWLNGGPGSTSQVGLFFELGPSSIDKNLKPVRNPHSWNNNASVIFIDQPVGAGYSYGSVNVTTTEQAAKHFKAFIKLFFKQFPEYSTQKFGISGESYGGHYVPVFSNELVKSGVRVDSVLVGNGLTHPYYQYQYYGKYVCEENELLSETDCAAIEYAVKPCIDMIEKCYNTSERLACVDATMYCNGAIMGPYERTGRNMYDFNRNSTGKDAEYGDAQDYVKYLNLPEVKAATGARVKEFKSSSQRVYEHVVLSGDWMFPYYTHVKELIDADIPVLIYAGDFDFICNWLGNQAWVEAEPFNLPHDSKPWMVDGEQAGTIQNVDKFSFVRIFAAGHFVPYDQGKNSLDMVNRWLNDDFTFQ